MSNNDLDRCSNFARVGPHNQQSYSSFPREQQADLRLPHTGGTEDAFYDASKHASLLHHEQVAIHAEAAIPAQRKTDHEKTQQAVVATTTSADEPLRTNEAKSVDVSVKDRGEVETPTASVTSPRAPSIADHSYGARNGGSYDTSQSEIPLSETSFSDTPHHTSGNVSNATKTSKLERFIENCLLRCCPQLPSVFESDYNEEQREEAYATHSRDLYRQRICLVANLAMPVLLVHALFYVFVSPVVQEIYGSIYMALFALCFVSRSIARTLTSQSALHHLCLSMYILFCIAVAMIVAIVGGNQNFVLGGHGHILLTTLLLPLGAGECLLVGALALTSFVVSGWMTFMPEQQQLYLSQLFTLVVTALFVVFVSFLQSTLRRRAFDASFDAMCTVARYQRLSLRDVLTGGHNRRYLFQTLDAEIARAARFSRPISLLLFDLDNFKRVNDTSGHAAGDRVLMEVWDIASRCVRNVDTPARYGGDEFAVVLPEASEDEAYTVASRLHHTVQSHMPHYFGADSVEGQVTLSIGMVTLRPHDVISAGQFLYLADIQLYNAKKAGKNCIA